jgi:outer membrane protein assembly factor BamB
MKRSTQSYVRLAVAGAIAICTMGAVTATTIAPRAPRHNPFAIAPLAAATSAPVTTYHNDAYRTGQYVVPSFTTSAAAHMHIDTAFLGKVTGNVYAQPLYWRAPGASNGEVIVATENNHVTALDATTGKVVWDRMLAAPVGSGILPCGNISPEGITGTPAIDASTGTVYVAATTLVGGAPASLIFGLSLKNGQLLAGWPVNVDKSLTKIGFSASDQGERGALTVWGNQLYVPYGGRFGDCDNYHGTVVALSLALPAVTAAWQTLAVRGGIWSVGGLPVADNFLYASTGNTSGVSKWSGGEAILRFNAALGTSTNRYDYFTPSNWLDLDNSDSDLGGTNPLPIDVGGRKLIVALGKDGKAYVADRTHLGGEGGELAVAQVSNSRIIGGPASWVYAGSAYIAFQGGASASACGNRQGLTVLRLVPTSKPSLTTAWCAALDGAGDPIVTTTNGIDNRIVWVVGAEGDGQLHGFLATNGKVVFNGGGSNNAMQNTRHMSTILAAQGKLYVPSDGRIYAFIP